MGSIFFLPQQQVRKTFQDNIYKLHELRDENLRRLVVGSPACKKKWHINVLIFVQGDMMNAEINSQTQPNPWKLLHQRSPAPGPQTGTGP